MTTLRSVHPELYADLESQKAHRAQRDAEVDKAILRALTGEESVNQIAKRLGVSSRRVKKVRGGGR